MKLKKEISLALALAMLGIPAVASAYEYINLYNYSISNKIQNKVSSTIYNIDNFDNNIGSSGGIININIFCVNDLENENIIAEMRLKETGDFEEKEISVSGTGPQRNIKIEIPKNDTTESRTFEIIVRDKTEGGAIPTGFPIEVTQEAGEETTYNVSRFSVSDTNFESEGGTTSFTIQGNNLEEANLSLKVEKNGEDVTSSILGADNISYDDLGEIQVGSGILVFPACNDKDYEEYSVKLLSGGKEISNIDPVKVTVGIYGSDKEPVAFVLKDVYVDGENKIVLQSDEPIYEIIPGSLVENISIDMGEGYKSIPDTTKAEFTNDNKTVILTFDEKIDIKLFSMLKINKGTLKNENGNPFLETTHIIDINKPIINKIYLGGDSIFSNKGGNLDISLEGKNLSDGKIKVELIENKSFSGNDNDRLKISGSITGDTSKKNVNFEIPSNDGSRTVTYTLRMSTDGGLTYTSELGDIFDKSGRMIISVLPEGKTSKDQTLGFMDIQSYGTSGNNTHTYLPTNQESKKTFVHVYGTNLDEKKTKVRIKDEYGAIWIPSNEPAKDSSDRFVMVGINGTGISGNGNHQVLEIICPNAYKGVEKVPGNELNVRSGQGYGNTFTYEIAIDGVNFDEKVTVKATVVDDGSGNKPTIEENLSDVKINYLSDKGKVLYTKEAKLMKNLPLYVTEAMPLDFDGYEYIGIEGVESENPTKDLVGERKEINFIYRATKDDGNTGTPSIPSNPTITQKIERIWGANRYDTSIEISKKAFSNKVERVVLVSGEKFPDALSASPLTSGKKGPVLLINDKNIEKVIEEIKRLNPSDIIYVGGNSISNENIEKINSLNNVNKIENLIGKDRYETSAKVADKMLLEKKEIDTVIIADGRNYPDAVSVASYASKTGTPIILSKGDNINDSAKEVIKKYGIKKAIIVGGETAVGKKVEENFADVDRIAGVNRYETSKKIAETLFKNNTEVFVCSGEDFADSLSASYLAAIKNSPIIINKKNSIDKYVKEYIENHDNYDITIIGGDNAINHELFDK